MKTVLLQRGVLAAAGLPDAIAAQHSQAPPERSVDASQPYLQCLNVSDADWCRARDESIVGMVRC